MNFCINNTFLSFCESFWLSCLACTIDHGKSKFDPRGKQCIYLGNYSVTKGSVLLDISSQNLFVSRDVLFSEHIFPYKHSAFVSPTYIFSKFVYLQGSYFLEHIFPYKHSTIVSPTSFPFVFSSFLSSLAFDIIPDFLDPFFPLSSPYCTSDVDHDHNIVSSPSLSSNSSSSNSFPPPRRSTRSRHLATYLKDYDCVLPYTSSPYSIASVLSYDHLHFVHKSFVKNVGLIDEP